MIIVGNWATQDHFSKVSIYNFSGLKRYKKGYIEMTKKFLPWDLWEVCWVAQFSTTFSVYIFSVCSWENAIALLKYRAHCTKNEVLCFLIRISSVNLTKSAPADLVTFTKEILKAKLHFLCSGYLDNVFH